MKRGGSGSEEGMASSSTVNLGAIFFVGLMHFRFLSGCENETKYVFCHSANVIKRTM